VIPARVRIPQRRQKPQTRQTLSRLQSTYTQYLNVPNLKLPGYLRVQLTDTEFTARLFLGGRLVTQIKGTLG
jgi:hypothetical protein